LQSLRSPTDWERVGGAIASGDAQDTYVPKHAQKKQCIM